MSYLLTFQLGPVQDFLAAAKTTRDLWSGSYILSYLMASTITNARKSGAEIIFPNPYDGTGPTLKILNVLSNNGIDKNSSNDNEGYLLPTLPNKLLLRLNCVNYEEVRNIAYDLESVPRQTLKEIGESIKNSFQKAIDIERFDIQLNSFLEIYWAALEIDGGDISKCYKNLNRIASAAKNLRFFSARNRSWFSENLGNGENSFRRNEKDFLSGKDENVILSCQKFHELDPRTKSLIRYNERLGAINLTKRLWHLTYLQKLKGLPERWFIMPCAYDIAKGKIDKDSSETKDDLPVNADNNSNFSYEFENTGYSPDKYYAVLAFDGDKIGKWVSGENLKERNPDFVLDESYLKEFSDKLNQFTMIAKKIVDDCNGKLIYAGGDDVLALLPSEVSIDCAQRLNKEFGKLKINEVAFESSCGIAIGHVKIPLQDIVKQAQQSEKDAKNVYGRNALSIHILKRSGEIIKWGSKFDNAKNFELLNTLIFRANNSKSVNDISEKFLYDFMKVLYRYISNGTKNAPILNSSEKAMILESELLSTMESKPIPEALREKLRKSLKEVILNLRSPDADSTINSDIETLLNLFQVAAWMEPKPQMK